MSYRHRPLPTALHFFCLLLTVTPTFPPTAAAEDNGSGRWDLLQSNLGIVAMHMQLLHNDLVVIYDRTDFGPSNISLPNAPASCRYDPSDQALVNDCTAHSVEYNPAKNTFRPLTVLTDVWCSSGSVSPDGRLIQTGGFNDGEKVVRIFDPNCGGNCDWKELGNQLLARRWYSTNHILPDGQVIIVGGRRSFNYEFYPKSGGDNLYSLRFLAETNEHKVENNLYPFVFLNIDGNLFIFANNRAILFDYTKNAVLRNYPTIPGGEPRSYPSTGSAVLLPFRVDLNGTATEAEVLVCGGAPRGAYQMAQQGKFLGALNTCGRIKITDPDPKWVMETMPMARVMGDMIILPHGKVLIINGAASGAAGWEFGRGPVLQPVIYDPESSGSRFQVQRSTNIPRMYHSSAILVRDGRVLVGGSNPHIGYNFTTVNYPTELRLEAFSPPYMGAVRPRIVGSQAKVGYGDSVEVRFEAVGAVEADLSKVTVNVLAPPFATHSFGMNQRMLVLSTVAAAAAADGNVYRMVVKAPNSVNLAPAGYYILFVVHQGIPSEGAWLNIG